MQHLYGAKIRKEKAHKLKKKLSGHRPGVPGTSGGTNRGLPAGVPGTSCFISFEELTEKAMFAGTPGCLGGFQKFDVIFSYVPFLLPIRLLCFCVAKWKQCSRCDI